MKKNICDKSAKEISHPLIAGNYFDAKVDVKSQVNKVNTSRLLVNIIALTLSLMTFYVFWFTNLYNRVLVQQIVLKENSVFMNFWLNLPMDPVIRIYVFNYTNIHKVLSGAEVKIKVEEIGPYTYHEPFIKADLDIQDDKISYFENRSHIFVPKLSGGLTEDDIIVVPNMALIAGIDAVKSSGFFINLGFKSILASTKPKEFQNLTIAQFMHGFSDSFMDLIGKVKWDFKPEDIGILALRRGVGKKRMTIFSGTGDDHDVGRLYKIDNRTMVDVWKTDDCNKVDGSDGLIFSPYKIQVKENLLIYQPSFCRSLPITFDGEEKILNGMRTYRYRPVHGLFSTLETYPENKAYCEQKLLIEKQIDGVLDVSGCLDGNPPILISHPHFFEGSPKLFEHIEGLNPKQNLHHSLANLHPRLAFPLIGALRLQINIRVNSFWRKYYKNLPDGTILPVAWVEASFQGFPESLMPLLYLSTIGVDYFESFMKFGSIISIVISLVKLFSLLS